MFQNPMFNSYSNTKLLNSSHFSNDFDAVFCQNCLFKSILLNNISLPIFVVKRMDINILTAVKYILCQIFQPFLGKIGGCYFPWCYISLVTK